jgi:hypothetical protein
MPRQGTTDAVVRVSVDGSAPASALLWNVTCGGRSLAPQPDGAHELATSAATLATIARCDVLLEPTFAGSATLRVGVRVGTYWALNASLVAAVSSELAAQWAAVDDGTTALSRVLRAGRSSDGDVVLPLALTVDGTRPASSCLCRAPCA